MNHSTTARAAILGRREPGHGRHPTIRVGNQLEAVDTLGDTHPAPLDGAHAATYIGADDKPASMPCAVGVFLYPLSLLLVCGVVWAVATGGWL